MSQVLSIYLSSQITAIERQFGLNSAHSGFLLSCNDIGFLAATLVSSYLATRVHIPRGLAVSVMLYGVGGVICSLAYFVSKDMFDEQFRPLGDSIRPSISARKLNANDTSLLRNNTLTRTGFNALICNLQQMTENSVYMNSFKNTTATNRSLFQVGMPNNYTTTAVTVLAIGKYTKYSKMKSLTLRQSFRAVRQYSTIHLYSFCIF